MVVVAERAVGRGDLGENFLDAPSTRGACKAQDPVSVAARTRGSPLTLDWEAEDGLGFQ